MLGHPLVQLILTYVVLVVVTALSALLAMKFLQYQPRKYALCPRCGRTEGMKPYAHDPSAQSRTIMLLYCGLIPGLLYYIWTTRLFLCPHCLKVNSAQEFRERRRSSRNRQRRRSPHAVDAEDLP